MSEIDCGIEQVKWQDMESHLRRIRTTVFIEEQNVPEEMEWDEYDETCTHVIVEINGDYVATGRLLEVGQIGRMAVLKSYREMGIGSKVLEKLLSIAKSIGMKTIFLNAQLDAIGFYRKYGFEEEGNIFDDAGILHRKMKKMLIK
jgi:predicted GNAT family N-acyltransferase